MTSFHFSPEHLRDIFVLLIRTSHRGTHQHQTYFRMFSDNLPRAATFTGLHRHNLVLLAIRVSTEEKTVDYQGFSMNKLSVRP